MSLLENGFLVYDVLEGKSVRQELIHACYDFEEFNTNGRMPESFIVLSDNEGYYMSIKVPLKENQKKQDLCIFTPWTFGAMGFPSSFHHPFIRKLRYLCYQKVKPILKQYFQQHYIQTLFDRLCYRICPNKIKGETWHRDVAPNLPEIPEGIIFGGWLNLDSKPQNFNCIPGSQLETTENFGFVRSDTQENRKIVTIPPGHAIIFFQNILHEVAPTKSKEPSAKLFLGFRVSKSNNSQFEENYKNCIDNLCLPYIPSGQWPALYPAELERYAKFGIEIWKKTVLQNTSHIEKRKDLLGITRYVIDKSVSYEKYTTEEMEIMFSHLL